MKPLLLTSKTVRLTRFPISGGKQPLSLLPMKRIWLRLDIWPMVLGMQPWNSLLAKETTETVEFPMVSGIKELNLLLFKKMASNSLVKSVEGISPSKSLYLRSRYFALDHSRTTSGK
uniref:Uncharacterized protein n=1 Tax=Cucumis sativus TaxID=3659 RepID=A0A0A0KBB1_CUCSA